ncbi:MAG: hypothetical protein EOP39_04285 [Rubrivivax sp.]|nr:MAG: hypothetical protein EOP39_04285 [Rubrivivax sp.]
MSLLSDRISALLSRQDGLRPADIARIAGVSTASVSDWMSGQTKSMKPEPARRLSEHFSCDQNWLMTGIGSPSWGGGEPALLKIMRAASGSSTPPDVRQALTIIRNQLVHAQGDQTDLIGEALKLMAKVPDSDRAFEQAVALLSNTTGR